MKTNIVNSITFQATLKSDDRIPLKEKPEIELTLQSKIFNLQKPDSPLKERKIVQVEQIDIGATARPNVDEVQETDSSSDETDSSSESEDEVNEISIEGVTNQIESDISTTDPNSLPAEGQPIPQHDVSVNQVQPTLIQPLPPVNPPVPAAGLHVYHSFYYGGKNWVIFGDDIAYSKDVWEEIKREVTPTLNAVTAVNPKTHEVKIDVSTNKIDYRCENEPHFTLFPNQHPMQGLAPILGRPNIGVPLVFHISPRRALYNPQQPQPNRNPPNNPEQPEPWWKKIRNRFRNPFHRAQQS
jgi:hypothetical protein